MDEFLDRVLSTLEGKALRDQVSELAKNDKAGYPKYVRGVVMTKAHYEWLKQAVDARYTVPIHSAAEAQPTHPVGPGLDPVHHDEVFPRHVEAVFPSEKKKKKSQSQQWWDDGGWD